MTWPLNLSSGSATSSSPWSCEIVWQGVSLRLPREAEELASVQPQYSGKVTSISTLRNSRLRRLVIILLDMMLAKSATGVLWAQAPEPPWDCPICGDDVHSATSFLSRAFSFSSCFGHVIWSACIRVLTAPASGRSSARPRAGATLCARDGHIR